MTIKEHSHPEVYALVKTETELKDLAGKCVAIDIASFKLKAFFADAPSFYRPGASQTHNYRHSLAKLLSSLTTATGHNCNVLVVMDGGRMPL